MKLSSPATPSLSPKKLPPLVRISDSVLTTMRVSLRLSIFHEWQDRKDPYFRKSLRENIHALRTLRASASLYQEKHFFTK